jgi:hypothetical protein
MDEYHGKMIFDAVSDVTISQMSVALRMRVSMQIGKGNNWNEQLTFVMMGQHLASAIAAVFQTVWLFIIRVALTRYEHR